MYLLIYEEAKNLWKSQKY